MALDGKILRRALDRYEETNRRRSEKTARLRGEIYAKDPRIEELDRLLRSTLAEAAAAALRGGGDPEKAIAAIREKNLARQAERAEPRSSSLWLSSQSASKLPWLKLLPAFPEEP